MEKQEFATMPSTNFKIFAVLVFIIIISVVFLMLIQVYGEWFLFITLVAGLISLIIGVAWERLKKISNVDKRGIKVLTNSALNAWFTVTLILLGSITLHDISSGLGVALQYKLGELLVTLLFISIATFAIWILYYHKKAAMNKE
jgi:hypothetical protein